jgi:RNA polymerase sigma factor (sigma-70 family)
MDRRGHITGNEFYQLIKNDLKIIYRYLIKMGASREDAEDIIQETLYKALQNLELLIPGKVKAWLFKVSINCFYNICRKRKPAISLGEVQTPDKLFYESCINFESTKIEIRMQIQEVFSKLKDSQKSILILKYYIGLSCRDISKLFDTDENTIKTSLYRARKTFKKLWEDSQYEKNR